MKYVFLFILILWPRVLRADLTDSENLISPGISPSPLTPLPIPVEPVASTPPKDSPKRTAKIKNRKPTKVTESLPVTFESKSLKGTRSEGTIFLQDDVIVTQGDMRMESTQATIHFHPVTNEVKQINASGKVKFFKKNLDTGQTIRADAREAVFQNSEQKVLMRGEPRIWRGDDLMTGKQITYDLKSGWIKADRVEGVLQPGNAEKSPSPSPLSTEKKS